MSVASATTPKDSTDDLVHIEIDGKQLSVPKGVTIIQAADSAGIAIPRFCYHQKLPIAASCRMCLVEIEKMPKPSPACATTVAEGMKVFTQSEKTHAFQRSVMELLLINHPLDCPVCDQGGECELQDTALGYGRSVSRYHESKRIVPDEDLGPLVATEMTRCIHCTRCVRFTAHIAGTYELGGMYRGEHLQIGTYDGQPLMTELSGNVIDVCPVGALTNKVYQYRARPWELTARASIAFHDAYGSNLFLHTRRGTVLRAVPRFNSAINECWLADRDRFAHEGLYAQDRVSVPLHKHNGQWTEVTWADAMDKTKEILAAQPKDAVGILVHPSTSNEEGELLRRLAEGLQTGNIDHRLKQRDFSDFSASERFALSIVELAQVDVVILFGTHIRHELPLLHARLRQSVMQHGMRVIQVGPVGFDLTFPTAEQHVVPVSQMAGVLARLSDQEIIKNATRVAVIVGEVVENDLNAASLHAALHQFAGNTHAFLCRIPQGANAVGLTQRGVLPTHCNAFTMLEVPQKAYVLYGVEPNLDFAHPLACSALAQAKTIAFSAYASPALLDVADIILPIGLLPEIEASLTNLEGVEQQSLPASNLPGQARPGWSILRALGEHMGLIGFDCVDIAQLRDSFAPAHLVSKKSTTTHAISTPSGQCKAELVMTTGVYRVDAVIRRANALQAHPLNSMPCASVCPNFAQELGVKSGQMLTIETAHGKATLPVRLDKNVASHTVWVETGHDATAPIHGSLIAMVAA